MLKSVLSSNPEFTITLLVDEHDHTTIEIASSKKGPDLTQSNDVVVLLDGKGVPMEVEDRRLARATLGPWAPYAQNGFALMIRVHEHLDGWDFPPQDDSESDDLDESSEVELNAESDEHAS